MNVPVHESKVTNAQSGVEPQAYFEGASVDPTEARNAAGSGPDDWAVRRGGNRPGSLPSRPARPASHPGGARGTAGRYTLRPGFSRYALRPGFSHPLRRGRPRPDTGGRIGPV